MNTPVHADVVIIGGGISGMVAAYNIEQHVSTLKVIVLEAKEQPGGRTLTTPLKVPDDKTQPVDLGGHWISSGQINILRLINHLNLNIVSQYHRGVSLLDLGYNYTCSYKDHPIIGNFYIQYELKKFFSKLENLSDQFSYISIQHIGGDVEYYDTITIEDMIRNNLLTDTSRNIARAIVKTTCGMDSTQISALSYIVYCNGSFGFCNQYMTYEGGAREYWIQEGAQEICKRLSEKLSNNTVITNSPVLKIRHNENYVAIYTKKQNYISRYAIIAVPPKEILKIDFDPPLSIDRYNNLQHHQGTDIIKFALSYKEHFWRKKGYSGELLNCTSGPVILCYDTSHYKAPILTGYAIKSYSCQTMKEKVTKQLAHYWGCQALKPIDYIYKDWSVDNYNASCMVSRPVIGQLRYLHQLTEPEGRIHWAGTETAINWNGFMEGAVQAAYRASVEVLYQLRPQSLNYKDMIYNYYNVRRKKWLKQNWFSLSDDPFTLSFIVSATVLGLIIVYKKFL